MTEFQKARRWREQLDLTPEQLSDLCGYSAQSIYWFERGESPPHKAKAEAGKISRVVWQRYKSACAGVHARLQGVKVGW